MSATVRYDQQYCPIARALDVLGDRWILPILRELSIDSQRFSDLRELLPGIAPTVLTQRLRAMTDDGLVTTTPGETPKRSRYTLTDRGREAVPVLTALGRWGMPLLEPRAEDQPVRPVMVFSLAVRAYFDAQAAAGIDERYRIDMGSRAFTLSSVPGGPPHGKPDAEFTGSAGVWLDMRQGRTTLKQARSDGLLTVKGPAASVRNFQRIFQIA